MASTETTNATHGMPWRRFAADSAVIAISLFPAILVGLQGLARSYDAIPDQDMLWASEALRLLRGVAPSYADHPGAFWSLTYKVNFQLLSFTGFDPVTQDGLVTPAGINKAIQVARVQNSFLTGLSAALIYPVLILLKCPRPLAALASITCAWSSAILVAVSEIRHESISILFILLFIIIAACSYKPESERHRIKQFISILALLTFFASAFAKQQVLLTSPLAFLAVLTAFHGTSPTAFNKAKTEWLARTPSEFARLCAAAAIPWLIAASPDIDLINLPFWIVINIGLSLCISPNFKSSYWQDTLLLPLAVVGILEVFILKVLSPGWWRQAVTGFPSWMSRHADQADNKLMQMADGIQTYFRELFSFPEIALLAFAIATVYFAFILLRRRSSLSSHFSHAGLPVAWLCTAFVCLICSQRITSRYEAYFFIPLIIVAAKYLSKPGAHLERIPIIDHSLKACLIILLFTSALRSSANAANLDRFINRGQPTTFLCFGHHMDRSMAMTTASTCPNFAEAAKSKDAYDNWAGPR